MSKSKRIEKRINRIEDRFKKKVAKGKKGTDMDIELHERRIQDLRDKSPLNFLYGPQNFGAAGMMSTGNFTTNPSMNAMGVNPMLLQLAGRSFNQPQLGTQAQQQASFAAQQDPNNTSATGFNNAPASTVSSVPITTGGMSEQTQGVAEGIFGETLGRQRIMNPNRTVQPQGLISF